MPDSVPDLTALALLGRILRWRRYPGRGALNHDVTPHHARAEPSPPIDLRRGRLKLISIGVLALLCTATAYIYNEMRLDAEQRQAGIALTGGNPAAAPALIIRFGCAGCHSIPGVPEAAGQIGPPLNNLARQGYVGGVVLNTTDNLIDWIVDPRAIDPMSAMPRTGISAQQARDVAAYLLSLRG
jgi:cytochrome c